MGRARKTEGRSWHWRTTFVLATAALYTALCADPRTVVLASALWLPPVALAGYLLGPRAGVSTALYVALPLALAWYRYGVPPGESFPGLMVSTCVAVACGSVLGRIHDLSRRLRERLDKRRAAEAELRDAEEQSRALLTALPDTVCRIDRAGTVLSYQAPRGSAPSREEVGGARNISELLPADAAGEAIECINEALETGETVSFEYRTQHDEAREQDEHEAQERANQRDAGEPSEPSENDARDLEVRLVKGGEHEVIAFMRDVTELKRLQRELDEAHRHALQAAGTKGRFLATMSHQIRTPMNGVIGMTNVLLQTKLTPEQREYTTIIRNSGEALLSILDDVLDYSKIEAGKIELGRAPFPLRTLLEEIVELLSVRAHDKSLEIASMIDARVPDRVLGDRGRLRQVITNLLGNAVRFTHHGHVVLRVTVVGHDRDTVFIRFDVSDTGVGISREQQKN
ncbi:MAG TPA: histidine kinase dimerization/phospho-acceptor domain-containing protein, partial [Polyangiaceae bacterium]|nr:histidine kinase dimerization/phospho-acceptor domain-containing protein [Polyangiaceae bacterium]